MTVQLNLSFLTLILFWIEGMFNEYFTKSDKMSGIPYPVIPEVGTKDI
jgi:hypothetical protein